MSGSFLKEFQEKGLISRGRKLTTETFIDKDADKETDILNLGKGQDSNKDSEQKEPEDEPKVVGAKQSDDEDEMVTVPAITREKILKLHQLSSEILGLVAEQPEVQDEEFDPTQVAATEKPQVDVGSVIKELITTSWGGDNESQGKAVELLKGLAFSDDPKANAFMQKLDAFTSSVDPQEFV